MLHKNFSKKNKHSKNIKKNRSYKKSKKIGGHNDEWLKRHPSFYVAKKLTSVCSDAGICLAFGDKESVSVLNFFDNFNITNLTKSAKRIGVVSENGFVKQLEYEKHGYLANAVLKSSTKKDSDNLLYEALVGFNINKLSKRFPCFVETYGLYKYKTDESYEKCRDTNYTTAEVLKNSITLVANDVNGINFDLISFSCNNPTKMSVIIQHFKNVKTLEECITNNDFVQYELLYILFQVYMPLSNNHRTFTHYDLHAGNVLIYEPLEEECIEYHYHIGEKEVVFKSRYIAKIIDYGRSYFNMNNTAIGRSDYFFNSLCSNCSNCGNNSGFGFLYNNSNPNYLRSNSYINSIINNSSHDLRLMNIIKQIVSNHAGLKKIFEKLVYDSEYGTKQIERSGLPSKINNVNDAFLELLELVTDEYYISQNNNVYKDKHITGELHIYDNGNEMVINKFKFI